MQPVAPRHNDPEKARLHGSITTSTCLTRKVRLVFERLRRLPPPALSVGLVD